MYKSKGWQFPSVMYAAQIYSNASSTNLTTMANGSITLANIMPGDMIVTHEATYGHVMLVDHISGNSVYYVDQNGADGGHGMATYDPATKKLSAGSYYQISGVVHSPDNTLTSASDTVIAVKKLTQSDGTNELFWATKSESWWRSGTGLNTTSLIHISQNDVVAFDVQVLANGEHLLYTATAHNIWETWWWPGGSMGTSMIIPNAGNLISLQKVLAPDGSGKQLLFVMNSAGVDEYSWMPNGTIYGRNVANIANPMAMKWAVEPDQTQELFVATQSVWYAYRWLEPGNPVQVAAGNIAGITGMDYSLSTDGKHRLYLSSSNGLYEVSWYLGGSFNTWQLNNVAGIGVQKWYDAGDYQVLYYETTNGVYEYYWQTSNQSTLNHDTIIEGKGTVHSFYRTTDPGFQTVYLAADNRVWEAWWGDGGAIRTGTVI